MTKDNPKPQKSVEMPKLEINLRSRALGIHFDSQNLHLVGVRNQINQLVYKSWEVLPEFERRSDEEIQDFIEDFQAKCRIKRADAYMLLPRSAVICQIVDFPAEAADNLDEAMEYQLGNYFAIDREEYNFFPQIISRGDQLKVLIIAVKNHTLGHTFGYMRRWSPKLAGLSLDTLGLVNGLLRLDEKFSKGQIMIFRPFPEGLEMIGLRDGNLVLTHFFIVERQPMLPERDEDEDLDDDAESSSSNESDDEERDAGGDADEDVPGAVVDPNLGFGPFDQAKLVEQIEAGFSVARMEPNEVDLYYWAGSDQEDVRTFLANETSIPFQVLNDDKDQPIDEGAITGFGGAVCSVHDKTQYNLNMLPERQRKRHKRVPVILAAAVGIVALLFLIFSEAKAFQAQQTIKANLEAKLKKIQQQATDVASSRTNLEKKQAEQELYKPFKPRKVLTKLLESLAAQLPEDTYITNLTIRDNNVLSLQGESDQPFELQKILSDIPFLKEVKSADTITSGRNRDGKRRFSYQATLALEALN